MDSTEIIKSRFSHMNEMQRRAVFCTEGPLLILAGAGSGKTTVLVNRVAYILQSGLCRPWEILAITFTNKAAGELKERICAAVPEDGGNIRAATFHSTCAWILRVHGELLGYSKNFTVYGIDEQKKLVKGILKQLNIDEKTLPCKSILSEISKAKDKMLTPEQMRAESQFDSRKLSIAKVYEIYAARLKEANAMDFDDMLCNAVLLFQKYPDILEKYQNQFKYIMVDEYQDTNRVQYKFVSMLAAGHNNICVVGDDDQSIYKFRGATIENILSFENTFKGAKIIRLEQNYRSTKNILGAANAVIANNTMRKGKTLWTENAVGDKIELHYCETEGEEARFIARKILDGVSSGRKYSDYAVLYRMNAQSNAIETALSRSGVPHRIIGGHRFYEREEIRDMLAYLHVINNPDDDMRLSRIINVPKRAIGAATLGHALDIASGLGVSLYSVIKEADSYPQLSRAAAKLRGFAALIDEFILAAQSGDYSLPELYELIIEKISYKDYLVAEKDDAEIRIENIEELSSNIIKFMQEHEDDEEEAGLSEFLEEVSLQTDIDNYDPDSDACVMMTMHSAKGLEFPVVFIAGMEEGIFPSSACMLNPDELNEERRLAYVGITRAKQNLILTCAKSRMLFGHTDHNPVSRFVGEIPDSLVKHTGTFGRTVRSAEKSGGSHSVSVPYNGTYKKPAAMSGVVYSVGDEVLHNTFGRGLVTKAEKMGKDTLLEIAFEKVGTKRLMANFCRMEKL